MKTGIGTGILSSIAEVCSEMTSMILIVLHLLLNRIKERNRHDF
jgi:hypothetical protein